VTYDIAAALIENAPALLAEVKWDAVPAENVVLLPLSCVFNSYVTK